MQSWHKSGWAATNFHPTKRKKEAIDHGGTFVKSKARVSRLGGRSDARIFSPGVEKPPQGSKKKRGRRGNVHMGAKPATEKVYVALEGVAKKSGNGKLAT